MTKLLQADNKSILNLLLLNLSSHRMRVLAAIKLLAEMNQTSAAINSTDKIVRIWEVSGTNTIMVENIIY